MPPWVSWSSGNRLRTQLWLIAVPSQAYGALLYVNNDWEQITCPDRPAWEKWAHSEKSGTHLLSSAVSKKPGKFNCSLGWLHFEKTQSQSCFAFAGEMTLIVLDDNELVPALPYNQILRKYLTIRSHQRFSQVSVFLFHTQKSPKAGEFWDKAGYLENSLLVTWILDWKKFQEWISCTKYTCSFIAA